MISSLARSVKSRCRYCGPASNLPVWPLGQSDRRRDRVGSVEVTVAALSATDSAQAQARLSEGSDTTGRGPGPGPWAQSGPGELPGGGRWHAVGLSDRFSGLSPRTCQRPKPVPAPGSGLSQLTCWIRDDQWPGPGGTASHAAGRPD